MSAAPARTRRRLVCRGTVQGVGFRPAVYRLATGLGLAGWVRNDPSGATIEVEGPESGVGAFVDRLPASLPPLARLEALAVTVCDPAGGERFEVVASEPGERRDALVPADTAPCEACRAEMEDPADRRFRYPFTTCTDCGPRFSLVRSLPYDRERTSMAVFPLCPDCRREYTDPADRRFHAEPVCCPACGPRLELREAGRRLAEGPEALAACRDALTSGRIVAVKGLGGFQLACRADDGAAVSRLRDRKHRPTKPFALMVRDLAAARRTIVLDTSGEGLLVSPAAPVVLAPRRPDIPLDEGVAPGIHDLGVMLPTTPLHVELFRDAAYDTLVMTSGNRSEEPICRTDAEAEEGLADIADLFLLHDREVVRRVDDSVVRTAPTGAFPVRRARGYVPGPLPLPVAAAEAVLALGPHLQATACLAHRRSAVLSQHVGDLDSEGARAFLHEVATGLEDFLQAEAAVIAVDAHPDYPSTWLGEELARSRGARLVRVQHHLAHAAAVLAEHGLFPDGDQRTAALVLDGTGWGADGTAWGGSGSSSAATSAGAASPTSRPSPWSGASGPCASPGAWPRPPWRPPARPRCCRPRRWRRWFRPAASPPSRSWPPTGPGPSPPAPAGCSKRRGPCAVSPPRTAGRARPPPCWNPPPRWRAARARSGPR